MKVFTAAMLSMFLIALWLGSAFAVPPGRTLEFTGSPMGKVTFDGAKHAAAGLKCTDCHTAIFHMKKGAEKITAPHVSGKFCFACHNGTRAFDFKTNCTRCHKK
ncbi:MAG: hypothetical protein M0Z59_06615 [Nitrospiraceae bacterium]|nr:hypothetical protein [Nitrospiraceae bacterium]